MDLTEPEDTREATLHRGPASLTATAPYSAPKGRGAVSDLRLPPRERDKPPRARRRRTAHPGPARGAHARKDAR